MDTEIDVAPEEDENMRGRPRRRLARWGGVAALMVVASLVSSLTAVWASHSFSDVTTSNPHHETISWAVENDITQGFNDGTFRPTQAVSRQAMATFLSRYNDSIEIMYEDHAFSDWIYPINVWADCPDGKRAISGGSIQDQYSWLVVDSFPSAFGWELWLYPRTAGAKTGSVTAFAICAPESSGVTALQRDVPDEKARQSPEDR